MEFRFKLFNALSDILTLDKNTLKDEDIIANITLDNSPEAQLGLELFQSMSIGGHISPRAKKILSRCNSNEDICMQAISLCDPPHTPKRLYITAYSYYYAGAKYRTKAIEFLTKYADAGGFWEGTPHDILNIHGYNYNQLNANKANVYYYLGKCYEGEYLFDDAIEVYKKALSLQPDFQGYYIRIADMYRKKNDLDTALSVLNDAKKTWYYKKVPDFKTVILSYEKKFSDMKARGYIYKPRKRKNTD